MFLALLTSLVGCNPQTGVARVGGGGVLVTAPTREERLAKALGAVSASTPHEEILLSLSQGGNDVRLMADAPDKIRGLPENVTVLPMFGSGPTDELWWGTDEAALHARLVEEKISVLLLHRDVLPSVDRGSWVASRLYHDDQRELIALSAVDDEYLLYTVLPRAPSFPPQLAAMTASAIRQHVKGEPVAGFPDIKTETGRKWNLIAVLRDGGGGRELATGMCVRASYADCVVELAGDLEREHRRYAEWYGLDRLADGIDGLIIEVHRVTERARVLYAANDAVRVNDLWEMGIDGAIIMDYTMSPARVAIFPGAVSYTRSLREADQFLRHAATDGRLSTKRPWRDPVNTLEKIRTLHYMQLPSLAVIPLFRGVPPVPMEVVDLPALEQSVVDGGHWYVRNTAPFDIPLEYDPGQVTYKMWPSENRYSDEYNLVRHTLATWNTVQAWQFDPQPEFLEVARASLEHTMTWRKDETLPDGTVITFFEYPGDQDPSVPPVAVDQLPNDRNRKLGTVVVQLMGMIDLARATGSHEWDEDMLTMGNFILHMQDENGKFQPYYVPENHPYADERNDIVPGEAALSLVMLAEYTGDDAWLAPLPPYFEFYVPWWNGRESQKDTTAPWPAYQYDNQTRLDLVQFGPWSVMAANAYHRATGDEQFADFGLQVARWMIEAYQWDSARSPWPDYVGGYYKMPGELPAMQAFCYAEGTAAAYQLALRARPEEAAFFEQATRESARFALQMQYDELQTYPFSRGDEVFGGTRYAMNETKVRIDYVHHSLSSVYQYVLGAREDPNLPENVRLSPARVALDEATLRALGQEPESPSEDGSVAGE